MEKLTKIRYSLKCFKHESNKILYKNRLDELPRTEFKGIKEQCRCIKNCIHEASEEALGQMRKERNQRKSYWRNE